VLVSVKNDQLARAGQPPLPEQMVEAIKQPILEAGDKEGSAYYSTANLWDDGILDPVKTRDVVGLGLAVALGNPRGGLERGHGTFRM